MKEFRDLKLFGSLEKLKLAIKGIEKILDNDWYREKEKVNYQLGINPMYCFICSETNKRRACGLYLAESKDGYLYVSNIVPRKVGELSHDEYNYVLEEFHQRFVMPVSQELDIRVIFNGAERSVDNSMSSELASLLRTFSACANKSTGASHPLDKKRWYAFLTTAHKEKSLLDAFTLRRLLIEEEDWFEDIASELANEYEEGRSLLAYYDKNSIL